MEKKAHKAARSLKDGLEKRRVSWNRKGGRGSQHLYLTKLQSQWDGHQPHTPGRSAQPEVQDDLATSGPVLTIPRVGGLGTEGHESLA